MMDIPSGSQAEQEEYAMPGLVRGAHSLLALALRQ